MKIFIEDLRFDCIIGILDFERLNTQEVVLFLEIDYEYSKEYINYALVCDFLQKSMQEEKFFLLEDALAFFSHKLKEKFPQIQSFTLKITKPSIMPNCRVSVANQYHFIS